MRGETQIIVHLFAWCTMIISFSLLAQWIFWNSTGHESRLPPQSIFVIMYFLAVASLWMVIETWL